MFKKRDRLNKALLLCGAAMFSTMATPSAAHAEAVANFNIPPQSLDSALRQFGTQSGRTVILYADLTDAKRSRGFSDAAEPELALRRLLEGTGLSYKRQGDIFAIVAASAPRPAPIVTFAAPETVSGSAVEGLVVTAQKRRENIQDVPIAISAFTQDALETSQIAGGPDLMTQVPNVTFTKTNFSGYSVQIRGIGTQAISATVDPAVAVAFNNTPFVRNRFFEQEFYDLDRVEVLRGPQGTLYGRNATAGVINILSAKPTYAFETKGSIDLGNYENRRLEAMVNIPLVSDKAALRLAGAATARDGYVLNQLSGQPIDGRNLWSTRLTLLVEPTDNITANLIYEHFEEDDDRLRSGKQLCKRDPGPTEVGGVLINPEVAARISQGCLPASLYDKDSFQVPNGYALPYYGPLDTLNFPAALGPDPYVSATQSSNLRSIESSIEPEYRAKNDTIELQIQAGIGSNLSITSETAYAIDEVFSFQDFNRFNTAPGAFTPRPDLVAAGYLDENGVFCDPQLGCSDRLVVADLSKGEARQFSQEFRLSSDYDGPFNFNLGANFLRSDSIDSYYVFFNSLSLFSAIGAVSYDPSTDNSWCMPNLLTTDPRVAQRSDLPLGCIYIDPNPISNLSDLGRNYFLSKNPYKLISYAIFGEVQYDLTSTLKLTAGLRWTIDKKRAPIIPSWLLTPRTYGLAYDHIVKQEWSEPTGRLVLDWKPDLAFTDDTMIYVSLARGYKAGGANPPLPANAFGDTVFELMAAAHPSTFDAEFVNAFEIGTKNTLFDGGLSFNANAFYYDYEGYQISQIVDRSALNLNFDAEVWGGELEIDWRPLENLRLGFKGGYENTKLADGSQAIDMMDRTAGNTDWVLVKPFPIYPSNCVLPVYVVERLNPVDIFLNGRGVCAEAYFSGNDPITRDEYTPFPFGPGGYPGFDPLTAPNGGAGFFKDLSGNELPNAPDFTAALTVDYTLPLPDDWLVTLHTDIYYQSEAWTRVFNTDGYDKLKAYNNINLAAIFQNEESGWRIMAYVKNVLDRDSITGAFLNSDDTGLTTNVFLTEPRLYGVRITKEWSAEFDSGIGLFGLKRKRAPGEPYPLTLELGGGLDKVDAPNGVFTPAFSEAFSQEVNPLDSQNDDLDWGDSRDVRMTYALAGDDGLKISAGVRFGRVNGESRAELTELAYDVCGLEPFPNAQYYCDQYPDIFQVKPQNYGIAFVHDEEQFTLADFTLGKDIGLGAFGEGSLEGGLRFAQFESKSLGTVRGVGDWSIAPEYPYSKYAQHDKGVASFESIREFDGFGPVLSLSASKTLIETPALGRVGLDASLTGGILFGDRETTVSYEIRQEHFDNVYYLEVVGSTPPEPVSVDTPPPVSLRRTSSVSAPLAGATLGLSYKIDRLKVSAGYRYDRFFDVIDGGVDERKSYDRTIQGPYFKVAIGFGG